MPRCAGAWAPGRDRLEWGWLENRPFLRCLASWMHVREEAGAREEALDYARELFALNPNDSQGVRCVAMTWLLHSGGNEEAAALAKGYPEDVFAETTYGRALALVRLGRFDEADHALRAATADLPLVAAEVLKAKHRAPRRPYPGSVTVGGADQAYDYWHSDGAQPVRHPWGGGLAAAHAGRRESGGVGRTARHGPIGGEACAAGCVQGSTSTAK